MKWFEKTNWYKKSQFTPENTQNLNNPTISVEPYEPVIQEVVNDIKMEDPTFFNGVNKIKVDMGYNQLGSVESSNPGDININIYKIKSDVMAHMSGQNFDINNPQHKQIMKDVVKKTIYHEKGHVEDALTVHNKSPEQGIGGKDLFPGGEPAAEQYEQKLSLSASEKDVDWKKVEKRLHDSFVGSNHKIYNKKKNKQNNTSCHSLDPHCDGGDDGW